MNAATTLLWNDSLLVCGVHTARGRTLVTDDFPGGFVQFVRVDRETIAAMKKEYLALTAAQRYKITRNTELNLS